MAIVFEDHSEWVKKGKLVTFQIARSGCLFLPEPRVLSPQYLLSL